jgi:oxalate decarboxylase/phosphoglucose isomerase-like protein (cupin superfamily)
VITTINDCKLFQLPRITERIGTITAIVGEEHVPFMLKRIYYLYDVPSGESRGGHAHQELQQLIVSVIGSFDIIVKDGKEIKRIRMDRASDGLYVPKMIWRELENFSSGAICLVLASLPYDEKDYIRDYKTFLQAKIF